jgi:hypothetical protein
VKNGIENYSGYKQDLECGHTVVVIKVPGYKQYSIVLSKMPNPDWNIFSDQPGVTELCLNNIKRFVDLGKKTRPGKSEDE